MNINQLRLAAYALSLFFWSSALLAQDPICFDQQNGFFVRTPKGWVLDSDATARLGYCAVFRKEGFTFHTSPAGIYVRILPYAKKNEKGELDLARFIQEDLEPFQVRTNDRAKVREEKDPEKKDSQKHPQKHPQKHHELPFVVRVLSEGPVPNEFERIGYLPAKEAVLLVVLTARKLEDLEVFKADFDEARKGVLPRARKELFQMLKKWSEVDETSRESKKYPDTFKHLMEKQINEGRARCSGESKKPFEAVLALSGSGKVMSWITEEVFSQERCWSSLIKEWAVPRPPFEPYFLRVTF